MTFNWSFSFWEQKNNHTQLNMDYAVDEVDVFNINFFHCGSYNFGGIIITWMPDFYFPTGFGLKYGRIVLTSDCSFLCCHVTEELTSCVSWLYGTVEKNVFIATLCPELASPLTEIMLSLKWRKKHVWIARLEKTDSPQTFHKSPVGRSQVVLKLENNMLPYNCNAINSWWT